MSWWAKTSLILLLTLATTVFMYQGWYKPVPAQAAISSLIAPVSVSATSVPASASFAIAASASGQRMLVAGVTVATTAAVAPTVTCTYGGTALTAVANTSTAATSALEHTYMFYMTDNTTLMNGTSRPLTFTVSAGTMTANSIHYAVYDGVSQTAPTGGSYNSGVTNASTMPLTTRLSIFSGDIGFGVAMIVNSGLTAPLTIAPATNWTSVATATAVTTNPPGATNRYCFTTTTADSSTASHTPSAAGRISSSAMVIRAFTNTQMPATISGCSQCHASYPSLSDGTARNNPPGTFLGSHSVAEHGTDCTLCHVSNSTFDHSNGNIEMAASIRGGSYGKGAIWAATNTPSALNTCSSTQCHGAASPAWGATGAGGCATCHSDTSATAIFKTTAGTTDSTSSTLHVSHLNRTHAMSTTVITCADCHTVPGTVADLGHNDSALPAEVKAALGYAGSSCATASCHNSKAPAWTGTMLNNSIADCSKCHDLPPTPGSGAHASIPSAISTIAGLSACSSLGASGGCHPTIAATPTLYTNIFADVAKHINGSIEGGSCTGCHDTGGSGDKNGRVAVTPQFNTAGNSHHVQTTASGDPVDVKACYACHWEANADGTKNVTYHTEAAGQPVNLVVWNATIRPTTYTVGTTAVEYLSGGTLATSRTELAKINSQCISCHNTLNKTTAPFTAAGDTSPTSKYAWDGIDINTKWVQAGTTPWGKFNFSGGTNPIGGTNAKNLVTKAFSAHNNTSGNQMGGATQTDTTITNISGATAVLCFDCHNSHGSSVAGITSQYSSATGRNKGGLIKDVAAGKGGYVNAYKPVAHTKTGQDTASFSAGATICFDCHNSASGTLTAGYTASGTAPWGYQTFGATAALSGYLDTPYFGAFTMPVATRTPYKAGVANAKAMPLGGHYGTSVVGTPVSAITKQAHTTTVTAGLQGLCTPCHDPHGVTTNTTFVPTQANAVPLLKGTWVTSPYKEDKADIAVQRGGGSRYTGFTAGGAIPGYHIDQNTLIVQPNPTGSGGATTASARSALRSQKFAPFTNAASSQQTFADTNFAGLCIQCHAKAALTNATAPSSTNWKTTARIHQSVKGWAATTGNNVGNKVHAYTCSKCHAPHTSRLPRLLVTNCLDVKHFKQNASSTGTIPTAAGAAVAGNVTLPVTTGGTGRFPAGGGLHKTQWPTAFNPGPWWFQQTNVNGTIAYGSNCHNAANAGGTAYNPTNQMWNNRSSW